jgi:hypothetical protein
VVHITAYEQGVQLPVEEKARRVCLAYRRLASHIFAFLALLLHLAFRETEIRDTAT